MSDGIETPATGEARFVISVDAMGGDRGPAAVVAGLSIAAEESPGILYLLHGDESVLRPLVAKRRPLDGRVEIRHAARTVTM
ncbi:MAG: phosphate acyltransferase, partial [Paracoccaceae bacterium]